MFFIFGWNLARSPNMAAPLNINVSASSYTTCLTLNYPILSKPFDVYASGTGSYIWAPFDPSLMTYSAGPHTSIRPLTHSCYTVTGLTAICSGSSSFCLNVENQYTILATAPDSTVCSGDNISLSAKAIGSGSHAPSAPLKFMWSEVQGSGTY